MKKYRILVRLEGEETKEYFVDNLSEIDLSSSSLKNVTIMGSEKSIKSIQKSQNALAKKSRTKFSNFKSKLVFS